MGSMGSLVRASGVILLTALSAWGCASSGVAARPEPFPRPPGSEGYGEPATAGTPGAPPIVPQGTAIVAAALRLKGTPYAPGGSTPIGFDCSGFVQYVFAEQGLALPRTVTGQFDATVQIPFEQLAPGDLLFFRTFADEPSHVAIAVGDGTFVHAPSSRGVVRVESLTAAYWRERFDSVRRVQ